MKPPKALDAIADVANAIHQSPIREEAAHIVARCIRRRCLRSKRKCQKKNRGQKSHRWSLGTSKVSVK